jgi:hypothetical protein
MPEEGESSASATKKIISKDDRPIDNMQLAELLRESAKFVEEGKFDPILYEALQDFRVYYKQKYPKTVKRTKSDEKSHKKKGKKKSHTAASSESTVTDAAEPDSTRTLENETTVDESQHSVQEELVEAVTDDNETATATTNTTDHTGDNMPFDEPAAAEAAMKLGAEQQQQSPPKENTPNSQATQPHANVPESAPYMPAAEDEPIRVETAVPLYEPRYQYPSEATAVPVAAAPSSTGTATTASSTTHNTATKFHLGQAVFGKLGIPKVANNLKHAALQATSKKNAQRAREDLGAFANEMSRQAESTARRKAPADVGSHGRTHNEGGEYYEDWCDVHFCKGCACKSRNIHPSASEDGSTIHRPTQSLPSDEYQHQRTQSVDGAHAAAGATHTEAATSATSTIDTNRPSFQRPTNKDSPLIVNGWIEQYRRSKMRYVWKEVLASLVKGRNPGEETTLWIQREIFNPMTGRKELEALERIPLKIVEDVELKEYTTDHQFSVKIFNNSEEFVFRCNEAPANSMMWVQTLRKYQMIARGMKTEEEVEEKKDTSPPHRPAPTQHQQQAYPSQQQAYPQQSSHSSAETSTLSVNELRAICHGAGISTAGMERSQLIYAADQVRQRGTYFDNRGPSQQSAPHVPTASYNAPRPPPSAPPPVPPPQPTVEPQARSVSDSSIEQPPPQNEERVASDSHIPTQEIPTIHRSDSPSSAPPHAPPSVPDEPVPSEQPKLSIKELRAICHGAGINTIGMERSELEAAAKEVQSRGTYFEPPPGMHAPSEDEIRAKQEEYRKHQEMRSQQEELRRRQQEQQRQEEEARVRAAAAAEEEARRQAAAEQLRRQQEAQAQYQQQQAAWQRQKQEEEQRQRYAQQQAAEQQRQREEAHRKQQQWAQQHPQQPWNQQPHAHGRAQHPGWQQQQQQYNRQQQQQPQQQQPHHTAAGDKYAAMANQTEDNGQAAITRIKHDILIHWALQPPQLQMLRSVDVLITTIHKVFPPALGVPAHEYFEDFKPITRSEIAGPSGLPDDTKLKKAVRKLRFFLHPDRLPRDLNEEQKFMTKMLWDVTSDAWEEYQKSKEDLDWVTN